ncbi:MAG: DNA-binding protein [Candidatus Diapherotrites archaeon]
MDELEAIKQKKLEQMQQQNQQLEIEAKLDEVARKILTPEAKARLGNVKLVNRELYINAIQTLLYLYQQGQIQSKIDEADLKLLLEKIRAGKREISITRK